MSRTVRDSLLVGAIALLVRLPAFFAPQSLGFDDGQFAMSVIAMRHGGVPFREVFSSQGPLFLPIAFVGDLLTLRGIDSPRTAAVLAGVALSVLVLLLAQRLTDRGPALLAAVLVAGSGSVLWTTAPLTSDGIAAAITVGTALAAVAYWATPSTRRAALVGLLAGAALAVKSLLVIPGLVAAGLWLVTRRRIRDLGLVAGVGVVVLLVTSAPWGLGRVYDQYVRYHTDAVANRPVRQNLDKLVDTITGRDAPLLAAAAIAAVLLLVGIARRGRHGAVRTSETRPPAWPVIVWLVLVLGVVLTESPMWRNHVAHVAVPVAVLVAIGLDRSRVRGAVALAAAAAILLVPVSVVNLPELIRPHDPPADVVALDRVLHRLPPGALVISDTPGLTWRAGRRAPDNFVDVSILRITSPTPSLRLTGTDIVRAARRPDLCAVVRWSNKRFTHFPALGRRLRAEGYTPELRHPGHAKVVWIKRRCDPPGAGRAGRTTAAEAPRR